MSDNEENGFMIYVKLMSFLMALALVIVWVFIILGAFFSSFGDSGLQNVNDRSAVLERLKAVEVVAVQGVEKSAAKAQKSADSASAAPEKAAPAPEAAAGEIDGKAIVTTTCFACHSIGLLESPKIGDKAAWDKRLQANGDMAGLVASSVKGKGAMPPKGGNANLTDAQIQAAIEFMMQ